MTADPRSDAALADARGRLERTAAILFVGAALVMAVIVGSVIVAGYFAGVIEDHAERVFWAGAVLNFIMIAVLAAANLPGGADDRRTVRRITWLLRIGLVLFIVAPSLCVGALIADFYG